MPFLRSLYTASVRRWLGTTVSYETSESIAALTFDDGPDPEITPRVVDLLERHGARGTFFMVGARASQQSALVQRIATSGHAVANHTFRHRSMARLSGPERRRELRECRRALAPHGTALFRPPWGEQTLAARWDAFLQGYDVIGWSVDAGDWWDPRAETICGRMESALRPGSIILLHDQIDPGPTPGDPANLQRDREPMLDALHQFLERTASTFRFVTVPELARHARPVRRAWLRGASAQPPADAVTHPLPGIHVS